MHLRSLLFNMAKERALFGPLHDKPASELELHLRFDYATRNFMAHIEREYGKSRTSFETIPSMGEKSSFNLFFPKRKNPLLLITELTTGYLPIILSSQFEKDPLYPKFKSALKNRINSFEFQLESEYIIDDEYDRLAYVFKRAYNDPAWTSQLPKLLLNGNCK